MRFACGRSYSALLLLAWAAGVFLIGCVRESGPATRDPTPGPASAFQVGTLAPDFELPSLAGGAIRLSDLRGRAVVVNFWASWCGPCAEEMPALQALHVSQSGRGPAVVAINQGEDADTAQAFVRAHGLTFPVALDADQKLGLQYHVIGLPASIWIDANGTIVDRVAGSMAPDVLEEKAARVLANSEDYVAQAHSLRDRLSASDRERAVALLNGQLLVSAEDLERRTDLLLALEQLDTGLVLDPNLATDATEIDQRRTLACRNLIDEQLLVDATTAAGFQPDTRGVAAELERVTQRAGGPDALEGVMRDHGVSMDDLHNLFQRGAIAQQYSEERVLSAETVGPPDTAIRAWLDAERTRRGVQVVDAACG